MRRESGGHCKREGALVEAARSSWAAVAESAPTKNSTYHQQKTPVHEHMHCQNSHSGGKANVDVACHPIADRGAMQQPANTPAFESDRRHKRCQTGCSTHIAYYIGRAVAATAAITTLCIFGLREEAIGGINHVAVAARALRQPSSTLNEQNTSSADERIRQAESNGGIRASRHRSSSQRRRSQNHQRCLRACYRNSSWLVRVRVLTGPNLARRRDRPSSGVHNYGEKSLYRVSAYVLFPKTAHV